MKLTRRSFVKILSAVSVSGLSIGQQLEPKNLVQGPDIPLLGMKVLRTKAATFRCTEPVRRGDLVTFNPENGYVGPLRPGQTHTDAIGTALDDACYDNSGTQSLSVLLSRQGD
jgi:hypothetical protein